ncbi:MAG: anti-sigma factor family protein, partial [Flavobacteriales bacterium]
MTEWEKTTALIERYLDGELSGEERLAFEEQLEADPLLADELSFHRELRAGIRAAGKEKGFRDELQHIHNELYPGNIREGSGQASGKIEIKSRTYRILAYAAMIAIVISAGSLLTYHLLVNHTKDKELYTELKRMIRETQLK